MRNYDSGFVECAICIVKPGTPDLCTSCIRNKNARQSLIADLKEVNKKYDEIKRYLNFCKSWVGELLRERSGD